MPRAMARRASLALLALALLTGFALIALPSGRAALGDAVAWMRAAGAAGQALAAAAVVVGIPLGIPTLWFCALLGYLYGFSAGLPVSLIASFMGATLAFTLARWLLRAEVLRLIAGRPRWRAVVDAVGEGGAPMVALLRIAGPHNMLNLALAASPLTWRQFAAGTFLGSIPSVTVATFGGALAPDAAALWQARAELGPAQIALLAAGAVALAVAGWILVRATRRALARAEAGRESGRPA
jgi:uncharacterized membrane protein YdjX (TVP38/TMEM64 family)